MNVNGMRFVLGFMLLVAACAARDPRERGTAVDPASQRVTSSGPVVGFVGKYGSHVWLGIPYAKPPVGDLRWRVAQAPDSWTRPREALALGSPCVQYGSIFGGVPGSRPDEVTGSEDCLYLNVYAPRMDSNDVPHDTSALPVMVWIHGGGNTIGEAGFFNGGNLAATQKVVVVTINYRLGPFGWLRHAALRDAGASAEEQSGNFGTLDMIAALRWVRDNIAAFGGDPHRVTIFGESAGGVDVYSLLLSPTAHGLFARAIVQSGNLRFAQPSSAEHLTDDTEPGDSNSSGEMILRSLVADGRAADRAGAKSTLLTMKSAEIAAYLRGRSAADVLKSYKPWPGVGMVPMPILFRDGAVLPADPVERFGSRDGYNAVPVMIGTNRDENKLFMVNDPFYTHRILWLFPRMNDERMYQLTAEYLARMWKATGADEPAALLRAAQGPSVYVYRFDWDEQPTLFGSNLSVLVGAAHGLEIPFVFGHFDLGREGNVMFTKANEPGRTELSDEMMSYWTEFARSGDPAKGRTGALPQWTAWDGATSESPKFMILDTAAGGGLQMSNQTVGVKSLLAALDVDPRLPTQRDKCMIYRVLAERSTGFSKQEYATAGRGSCAQFPYDAYPWG